MTANEFDSSGDLAAGHEKEKVPRKRGKVAANSNGGNIMNPKNVVKEQALAEHTGAKAGFVFRQTQRS